MLPGANIETVNGQIGGVSAGEDQITGFIFTGVAVVTKVQLDTAYSIFSIEDAEDLGIDATGVNVYAWTHLNDFFAEAGEGSEAWIMLVDSAVTMEDMADKTLAYAPVLLDAASGRITRLGFSKEAGGSPTIVNGLDEDVSLAAIKAQDLAEDYAVAHKPFRFLIDGKEFNGTPGDLYDYTLASYNRGSVLIAAIRSSQNASIGYALGVLASLPVQRKMSRVKNGPLSAALAYFTDQSVIEDHESAWGSMHDKGYIILRNFVGKAGYYFNDDPTLTAKTDDYDTLSKGFVIDKASRIAYKTYVEEVGNDVQLDSNGNLNPAIIKSLQGAFETAIGLEMVANGECSDVEALIDPFQNVLSTDQLLIALRILPVGYTNYIEIQLGFTSSIN